jgi:ADP-heptose:LPS heptosyltransferase
MEILVYSGLELLGDGVMKLPFVRALRRTWPAARITWLAGKGKTVYAGALAPLVRDCLDEVIEEAGIGTHARELRRRPLPERRFDLVIDTQRRVLTTLILRRIRAASFISGAAGFLLSSRRPPAGAGKPPSMIGQLFALLSVAAGRPVAPVFDLALDRQWTARAAALLPDGKRYIGIAPGAGGAHKRWPLDRFAALARAQIAAGRAAVFLLGPDEESWLPGLRDAVPEAHFPLQAEAGAASPLLTMALAQRLTAAIANDSGTGHLIAAAGCPLVSLFGPTLAAKFAPAARRLEIVDASAFGAADMGAIPLEAVGAAVERAIAAAYIPSGR